jgi:hypothetical protein
MLTMLLNIQRAVSQCALGVSTGGPHRDIFYARRIETLGERAIGELHQREPLTSIRHRRDHFVPH